MTVKNDRLKNFYNGKRVLVTGHTGFKGTWLTQILVNWGADVCGYSLKPHTTPNIFDALGVEKEIKHHVGDIRDFENFDKVVKDYNPDIIFHLAAQPIVRDSYDDPRYTYDVNVMGTVNVLESMRLNNIKTGVIITTDKVYKNFEKDIAYKEDDQLGGHDPYSCSKSCADLIVSSYILSFFAPGDFGAKHHTLIASARAGNVIGGGDWAKDRIVPDAMRAFLANKEDLIIRNPEAIRPWQHVFEPLRGYLLLGMTLFNQDLSKVGSWNLGPEEKDSQSVKSVLELIIKNLERGKYRVEPVKEKHESNLLKLDSTKAKKELGWVPKYNLEEAVKNTALWYKEFYSNKSGIKKVSLDQINNYFSN